MVNTGGIVNKVGANLTRPDNTTAYAEADVVSDSVTDPAPTVLTFTSICRAVGGSGTIDKVRIVTDQGANEASYRLHLYSASPTAIDDNAPFTILYAERASTLGYIDVGPLATEGAGSDAAHYTKTAAAFPFACSTTANLYGILETLSIFTPAAEQKFYVEITATLN